MAKYEYFEKPVAPEFERLIDKYPRLFHRQVPVCYSYVMPGWEAIIDRALGEMDKRLSDEEADDFFVTQIKEKFGSLRLYIAVGAIEYALIPEIPEDWPAARREARLTKLQELLVFSRRAEQESLKTCEQCGQPGRLLILTSDVDIAPLGFLEIEEASGKVTSGSYTVVCDFHARHWRDSAEEE